MARIGVYFDGFNIYFGLKELMRKNGPCYKWLDYRKLALKLASYRPRREAGDRLILAKLFTATVGDNKRKAEDHTAYLDALRAVGDLEIVPGSYQTHYPYCPDCDAEIGCKRCELRWRDSEEKKSDVGLGVHLVRDGLRDKYDVAIVVTGDSDQTPAIELVREECPEKRIIVAYPPGRGQNADLESACGGREMTMKFNTHLADCMLPDPVVTADGRTISSPWSN